MFIYISKRLLLFAIMTCTLALTSSHVHAMKMGGDDDIEELKTPLLQNASSDKLSVAFSRALDLNKTDHVSSSDISLTMQDQSDINTLVSNAMNFHQRITTAVMLRVHGVNDTAVAILDFEIGQVDKLNKMIKKGYRLSYKNYQKAYGRSFKYNYEQGYFFDHVRKALSSCKTYLSKFPVIKKDAKSPEIKTMQDYLYYLMPGFIDEMIAYKKASKLKVLGAQLIPSVVEITSPPMHVAMIHLVGLINMGREQFLDDMRKSATSPDIVAGVFNGLREATQLENDIDNVLYIAHQIHRYRNNKSNDALREMIVSNIQQIDDVKIRDVLTAKFEA